LLKDILVLDLADEQGSFCSRLLACLGATVVKVEGPGGDASRRKYPLQFFYDNASKLGVSVDLRTLEGKSGFRNLLRNADVLVETCRRENLESLGIGRQRLGRLNPRLIHLSITPFGRTGPKAGYRSSDGVASAVGGRMHVTGESSGPPLNLFGLQAYYTASLFGAAAVLLGLRKRDVTGKGNYHDLSIQEAVASTLDHVMIDYFHGGTIAGRGEGGRLGDFAAVPASDGFAHITILRNWDTLLELMAADGKAGNLQGEEWKEPAYREPNIDQVLATVREWTGTRTRRDLLELGQAMRFPWASVDTPGETLQSPQLKARGFFVRAALFEGGPEAEIPGLPCKFSSYTPIPPGPAPLPGQHAGIVEALGRQRGKKEGPSYGKKACRDERILSGIRVLDLTRMLSGPYATRILADFGAEVIKIQSQKTAHGAERNDTAYFSAWNRNKRSVTLDLDEPDSKDVFLRLVAGSDIVVENYSPRVMANWGLDYGRLRQVNPDLVMVSISAMGQTGPWRDFVGYAPTFHALSGLVSSTSGNLNTPAGIGYAYADVVAGLYAALAALAALRWRGGTGEGQHIDLSAYEAMCSLLGPAYIQEQVGSRFGIADARSLESRVYRCAGEDRWCAVTVENEGQWEEVDRLVGGPAGFQAPEPIVRRLQGAGIAAGVVQSAADLAGDEQLSARRFFISLRHPVLGKVVSDRTALWDWHRKPGLWKPSPLLGQDDDLKFEIRDRGKSILDLKSQTSNP